MTRPSQAAVREAADVFERLYPLVRGEWGKGMREFDAAQKVLKAHFEVTKAEVYRGRIICKVGSQTRFELEQAVEFGYLDEDKIEACKVEHDTRTLILLQQPAKPAPAKKRTRKPAKRSTPKRATAALARLGTRPGASTARHPDAPF